jgi:L-ribulose-5-phosphate 4-epimerase
MLEELKEQVCVANKELFKQGIVIYTWGNVSGLSDKGDYMVIKPSGVPYIGMKPDDMVVVNVKTGIIVEGEYKPSSDTETHLYLYRSFPGIHGIAHAHSTNAVAFAQAGMDIPALGTTHADCFYGDIPCTRELSKSEVEKDYEINTGKVIVEELDKRSIDQIEVPGCLVRNHGPFTWGNDPLNAVNNAVLLEKIADMALKTLLLNQDSSMQKYVLNKHYLRKHGPNSYYGQNK